MEAEKVLLALAVCSLLVILSKKLKQGLTKPELKLPPGPWTLPLLGSVHHLVSSQGGMYRAMSVLSEKHGPLMQLWLGEVPTVVASSPEAAREILKTSDLTFATRHLNATTRTATFDASDLVFAPYGDRWRQLRKICVLELLSVARVQALRRVREEEAALLVARIAASASSGEPVCLTRSIANLINDTIVRESIGARCKYQDEYLRAFDTLVRQTSSLTAADLFPSSRIMQALGAAPRNARVCRDEMERIIEQIIKERLEEKAAEKDDDGSEKAHGSGDFLDVMLRLQKQNGSITNRDILILLFDMFGAGSETSSTTLNWTMAELMRTPRVMAKAQAELRDAFQGKTSITEEDVAKLSYLKLVLKEALRLHCPLPLLLPRECRESCTVMGYDVPKGTAVLVNAWAICRDPKVWDRPEEFRPERFEADGAVDFKGTNYEFLPFGSGRRMCPGANLGIANMEVALASLLYHFDWKLPDGARAEDMDMSEAAGMVASKRAKLYLCPTVRVAPGPGPCSA